MRRCQPVRLAIFAAALSPILTFALCCDRATGPASIAAGRPQTTQDVAAQKVASLVPAATDLLIGMGAGDHLVAVSNWDANRAEIAGLPRVGDYRTIDFERLTALRPDVLITQFRADKTPPGLQERADKLHMRLENIHVNHLEDIYTAIDDLGREVGEPAKAQALAGRMRERLDAAHARAVSSKSPPVRTLLLRDATGYEAVGSGNFLDEILTLAGGKNVLGGGDNSYPTIDKEQLVALDPQCVIQLLPGAAPQVKAQAAARWESLGVLHAVREKRVYTLDDYYLLLPTQHMADLAETLVGLLHPETMPSPGVAP